MKATIEKILAAGGSVEIASKDGTTRASVQYGHLGRYGFGKTVDSAFESALLKLAKDSRELAVAMATESKQISDMYATYLMNCPPIDASFTEEPTPWDEEVKS